MSKLFINAIIQHGGKLSESEKISVLDVVSKHINKKMRIIEYKYGIKLKFPKLPENNSDCARRKIGIQTMVNVDGPIKGTMPIYTTTELPMPTISPVSMGVPLTPFGPYMGVQGLAINPWGNGGNVLEERIKKAKETLEKIIKIENDLKANKDSGKKCKDISANKDFECVDLEPPCSDEDIEKELEKIKN